MKSTTYTRENNGRPQVILVIFLYIVWFLARYSRFTAGQRRTEYLVLRPRAHHWMGQLWDDCNQSGPGSWARWRGREGR